MSKTLFGIFLGGVHQCLSDHEPFTDNSNTHIFYMSFCGLDDNKLDKNFVDDTQMILKYQTYRFFTVNQIFSSFINILLLFIKNVTKIVKNKMASHRLIFTKIYFLRLLNRIIRLFLS